MAVPNTGTGVLGTRGAVASGTWTAADHPLVAAGDVDDDDRPGLWTTTADGTAGALLFRPGTAAGGLGDPVTVGTGGRQWMPRMG
ncbi:hypothetical protein [Streptomyces sp. NPDC051642]|uniref:hypothetical protein n=1 Tax=unclassified Streptomyces TaxID=2593676 RepID=UPI003437CA4A